MTTRLLKGVLHVHSTFSDGDEPLERIVEIFRSSGMDFIAVSDHAEVFDEQRMEQYVQLCDSLSRYGITVVPGLEFALAGGDIHILGYGIRRRVRARDMESLVDGIHEAGGIAVLAHPPSGSANMIITIKAKLDGIEIWNGRYDGVWTPRAASIQLLRRIRQTNVDAAGFGGIDMHKMAQASSPIYVELEAEDNCSPQILNALKCGRFTIHGSSVTVPSSGRLTFFEELRIAMKQPFCRPWAG